ncbi:hypothetical protein FOZ62_020923, partial [Perkinsus olseni]
MSQFKFKVLYKKGKDNVVADALSRVVLPEGEPAGSHVPAKAVERLGECAPGVQEEDQVPEKLQSSLLPACVLTVGDRWSTEELVGQQEDDQVIRVVRDRVRQEGPLARTELKEEEYRPYRRVWLTLFVHSSGLLVRKVQLKDEQVARFVPVVPVQLRPEVLERFHALA